MKIYRLNYRPIFYAIVIFVFILTICIFFSEYLKNKEINQKKYVGEIIAYNITQNINKNINDGIAVINSLSMLLKLNDYKTDSFELWAKELIKDKKTIVNVQLAKDGIVSHVYPIKGHKSVIGHDLFKDKRRLKGAISAILDNTLTFIGPVKLIQNDKYAIIARKPLFKKNKNTLEFWGFCTIIIYTENIINIHNSDIMKDNFNYMLTGTNPDEVQQPIFSQSIHMVGNKQFNYNIKVPNGNWKLTLEYTSQQNTFEFTIYSIFFIIGLLLGYIVYRYEKNVMIAEESKLASMSEMIGNIAHQWRQPLSVISTAATGMKMEKEYNLLTDDKFNKGCDAINDNTQFLSKTIDDFRNFVNSDRKKKIFNINDDISGFLNLIECSIKTHNIEIIQSAKEDININGYENELTQCFINIFNNAKDALNENTISNKNKLIFISTSSENDIAIMKIKDNAGGIPDNILHKVFEPYFTTKDKSQGSGLGLHITYNLIVDGMNGSIEAKNVNYEYKNKTYTGAEFTITIPMS